MILTGYANMILTDYTAFTSLFKMRQRNFQSHEVGNFM